PPPPRHAWAVEVTRTGHTAWETPLQTRGTMPSPVVQPVVAGPVAVLAQDGIVHGISLADGHPLWSWPGGQSVYGLWRWGGLVAVLTDQVSNHARLTGLDAATGRVAWRFDPPTPATDPGAQASVLSAGPGGLAVATYDPRRLY